jgi:hypothetical protein
VDGSAQVIRAIDDLARTVAAPAPPLDPAYLADLARASRQVGAIVGQHLARPAEADLETLQRYVQAVTHSVELLASMHGLRRDLGAPAPPIDLQYATDLAVEAQAVALILARNLFDFTANISETLQQYVADSGGAIQLLRDAAALRKDLADVGPPIDLALATRLADEAQQVAIIVSRFLFNFTEQISGQIARYAETSANTVSVLQGVAGLRSALADAAGPIDPATILRLAEEARNVVIAVGRDLIPVTEEQAAELARYSDTAQSAISALSAAAGLRSTVAEMAGPIDLAILRLLAADARRATEAIEGEILPRTEEQAAAAQRWADLVGSATSALASVAGFGADLFTDYRSPSDAQLAMLANDARRIADAFASAAGVIDTEGVAQAQAYADALGSTFATARDGLLLVDAIAARESWTLDATKLGQFEDSGRALIATVGRLAADAAGVDGGQIAALGRVTAGATGLAEAFVALSAVPFDNLAGLVGALAGGAGGGGAPPTAPAGDIIVNVYPAPGQSSQQIADEVIRRIGDRTRSRV